MRLQAAAAAATSRSRVRCSGTPPAPAASWPWYSLTALPFHRHCNTRCPGHQPPRPGCLANDLARQRRRRARGIMPRPRRHARLPPPSLRRPTHLQSAVCCRTPCVVRPLTGECRYVPSTDDELTESLISASWAGGKQVRTAAAAAVAAAAENMWQPYLHFHAVGRN